MTICSPVSIMLPTNTNPENSKVVTAPKRLNATSPKFSLCHGRHILRSLWKSVHLLSVILLIDAHSHPTPFSRQCVHWCTSYVELKLWWIFQNSQNGRNFDVFANCVGSVTGSWICYPDSQGHPLDFESSIIIGYVNTNVYKHCHIHLVDTYTNHILICLWVTMTKTAILFTRE